MQLGCCGSPDQAGLFKAAGFDFIELNVQHVLRGDEADDVWARGAPDAASVPLPMAAANCLVPAHHAIVGPNRNLEMLKSYMKRVAQRARWLGVKRLVFGSGGARRRPEGVDAATTHAHLLDFIRLAGDAAGAFDITVVIEHLNAGETNTINKLADSLALANEADHPSVAVLVDSYHFGLEHEALNAITALGHRLRHVHVAEVVKRSEPGAHGPNSVDSFDFVSFFRTIRAVGYDERVAIECHWTGPMEPLLAKTAQFLRDAWRKAAP